ncbi:MAG: ROK family protein [Bacteroidales bacterium]|jgi:glucokinase|nr:ROK family protein [Bacteroidales bacterium]
MDKPYVVGVDVGGQTTKMGIVDRRGTIVEQTVINSKYGPEEANIFIDALCASIRTLTKNIGLNKIQGIGIGAPNGNYYKGTIENAANLDWARGKVIPLVSTVSKNLNVPVTVTNDANAAAVGEMTYGTARGMKDFIMITLGTGVGSGIVINGNLVYGHDGFAGELGHTCAVRDNGRLCGCGKRGCLETYASAIGVARTAREWLDMSEEPSSLRELTNISSKDVFEAASNGDKLAIRIFEFTGKILGRAFADFVAFSAPEAIILFGGLARAGKFILKPIKDEMNANLLPIWKNKVAILPSGLKENDAAILGASALAW